MPTPNLLGTRSTIAVVWAPDGRVFAAAHGDHTVRVYGKQYGASAKERSANAAAGAQAQASVSGPGGSGGLAVSSSGSSFPPASAAPGEAPLAVLRGHRRTPWSVRFHPTRSDILVSGALATSVPRSEPGEVIVWHWPTSTPLFAAYTPRHALSVAFTPCASSVVVAVGNELQLWPFAQLHAEEFAAAAGSGSASAVPEGAFGGGGGGDGGGSVGADDEEVETKRAASRAQTLARCVADPSVWADETALPVAAAAVLDAAVDRARDEARRGPLPSSTSTAASAAQPPSPARRLPRGDVLFPLLALETTVRSLHILPVSATDCPSCAPPGTGFYLLAALEGKPEAEASGGRDGEAGTGTGTGTGTATASTAPGTGAVAARGFGAPTGVPAGQVLQWVVDEAAVCEAISAYQGRWKAFVDATARPGPGPPVPQPLPWVPVVHGRASRSGPLQQQQQHQGPPSSAAKWSSDRDAAAAAGVMVREAWETPLVTAALASLAAHHIAREFGALMARTCTHAAECACECARLLADAEEKGALEQGHDDALKRRRRSSMPAAAEMLPPLSLRAEGGGSDEFAPKHKRVSDAALVDLEKPLRHLLLRDSLSGSDAETGLGGFALSSRGIPPIVGPVLVARRAVVFNDGGMSLASAGTISAAPSSPYSTVGEPVIAIVSPPVRPSPSPGLSGHGTVLSSLPAQHPDVFAPSVLGLAEPVGCGPSPFATSPDAGCVASPLDVADVKEDYARALHGLISRVLPPPAPASTTLALATTLARGLAVGGREPSDPSLPIVPRHASGGFGAHSARSSLCEPSTPGMDIDGPGAGPGGGAGRRTGKGAGDPRRTTASSTQAAMPPSSSTAAPSSSSSSSASSSSSSFISPLLRSIFGAGPSSSSSSSKGAGAGASPPTSGSAHSPTSPVSQDPRSPHHPAGAGGGGGGGGGGSGTPRKISRGASTSSGLSLTSGTPGRKRSVAEREYHEERWGSVASGESSTPVPSESPDAVGGWKGSSHGGRSRHESGSFASGRSSRTPSVVMGLIPPRSPLGSFASGWTAAAKERERIQREASVASIAAAAIANLVLNDPDEHDHEDGGGGAARRGGAERFDGASTGAPGTRNATPLLLPAKPFVDVGHVPSLSGPFSDESGMMMTTMTMGMDIDGDTPSNHAPHRDDGMDRMGEAIVGIADADADTDADAEDSGVDISPSLADADTVPQAIDPDAARATHPTLAAALALLHVSLWQRLLVWADVADPIQDAVHDHAGLLSGARISDMGMDVDASPLPVAGTPTPTQARTLGPGQTTAASDTDSAAVICVRAIGVGAGRGVSSFAPLPCHFGRPLCAWSALGLPASSITAVQLAPAGGHVLLAVEPKPASDTRTVDARMRDGMGAARPPAPGEGSAPPSSSVSVSEPVILRAIRLDSGLPSFEVTSSTTAVNAAAWDPIPGGTGEGKGAWGFVYGTQRGQIRRVGAKV
jgi:hypothetical protein